MRAYYLVSAVQNLRSIGIDERALIVAVFDDIEEIARLVRREGLRDPSRYTHPFAESENFDLHLRA